MIHFNYETAFLLPDENKITTWLQQVINQENCALGEINYIFCDDTYLHQLNVEFLNHDTLTDIISFDYCLGNQISGDIFISTERVAENAVTYNNSFIQELLRVIVHGILHFCGYKDKSKTEATTMREMENKYLKQIIL